MNVVVIGGSGLIGSRLVSTLRQRGAQVVSASLESGVNTLTGKGLPQVLAGGDVVVDVSNSPSFDDEAAMAFFVTSGRNLLSAEAQAGIRHHVALSIVGIDRLNDSGYFRGKQAQERLIRSAGIPYSILRSTQFFEFLARIADSGSDGDIARVPPALVQPILADEVVSALADISLGPPANATLEVAGPERFRLDELIRRVLLARNDPRQVVADVHARYFGSELDDDSLIPRSMARLAATRLETWLAR
jgi:uncharacterized protein YbjT (DUF2867 family)